MHGLKEPDPPAVSTVAFVLVPLVDEAALLALFSTQSTCLQFVEGEGHFERLRPAEDRVVHISIVDLQADRVVKMNEEVFQVEEGEEGPVVVHDRMAEHYFHSFEQSLMLSPSIEHEAVASGVEDGDQAATVLLFEEIFDESAYNESQSFASILELWKCLNLFLTGNYREY